MNRRLTAWAALAAFSLSALGCAQASFDPPAIAPGPGSALDAREFPVVEIVTGEGDVLVGKLARLEAGARVAFLPKPYWGVEMRILDYKDIDSIRNTERPSSLGKGVLAGIALAGIAFGVATLAGAEYDVDYKSGISGVPLAAVLLGAPLGALIGGMASASSPSQYNAGRMSAAELTAHLKRLMGI
jgi:hypothetical protein